MVYVSIVGSIQDLAPVMIHCKPGPCNENRYSLCPHSHREKPVLITGKACSHYRDPAHNAGNLFSKQVVPCTPPVLPGLGLQCKGKFFFRRYYVACQIANICKHFTAHEHFSVHRNSKMFAKIGDLTSSIISSEKKLTFTLSI